MTLRILANENFPADAVAALRAYGHDVTWVRTEFPGATDEEVLRCATVEQRIVATFDKDFGELAFRGRLAAPHGIILFRTSTPSPAYVARVVLAAIASRDDWAGHFSVVEDRRIRMTPLPSAAAR